MKSFDHQPNKTGSYSGGGDPKPNTYSTTYKLASSLFEDDNVLSFYWKVIELLRNNSLPSVLRRMEAKRREI